jgi:hypothetical protein
MSRFIVRPIFKQPNGYWWAYSFVRANTVYSLNTRDMSKAQAAYNEQLDRLRRYAGSIDPADAGMEAESQCAEWPRCACGRGGPDLCCECISQETCNCVSPDAYGRKHDADPADAGMDNPPEPEVEVLDRRLILAWKTIGELQQRVEELGRQRDQAIETAMQLQDAAARGRVLREALEWMDRKGGLGLDVHDRIRAALSASKEGGE